jgi:Domain of unknown function (DUF317)
VTETAINTSLPAYLADPGETTEVIDLATAAGWACRTDELGNAWYTAPTGHALLAFLPEFCEYTADSPVWKIEATGFTGEVHPRRWTAGFDNYVPTTLIAAFFKAMVTLGGDRDEDPLPAYLAGAGEANEVIDAATAAGWTTQTDKLGNVRCTAPTGHALLTFQPESSEYADDGTLWKVEATGFTGEARPRQWTAAFSDEVPAALITAFIEAMTTMGAAQVGDGALPA